MDSLLLGLETLGMVETLRFSRWGYALVNAAHILSLALLSGSILLLNIRLLGGYPFISTPLVARLVCPLAATGLAFALLTGLMLFATRAREYAALEIFLFKMGLILLGTLYALWAHRQYGLTLEAMPAAAARRHGLISLVCWPCVIVSGRLIAFAA